MKQDLMMFLGVASILVGSALALIGGFFGIVCLAVRFVMSPWTENKEQADG